MTDSTSERDASYTDLSVKYENLDVENRFARQVMLIERERCAKIAGNSVLEQDETGHLQNGNTWHAACAYIVMKIRSGK